MSWLQGTLLLKCTKDCGVRYKMFRQGQLYLGTDYDNAWLINNVVYPKLWDDSRAGYLKSIGEVVMHTFPSDIARMPEGNRVKAYHLAIARNDFQDTLASRISARVELTSIEIESLCKLLTKGCRQSTKQAVMASLNAVPYIKSRGIFDRVQFENGQASYCAGQDYPSEIRTVRECLL
jgi:hypothetical protein